MGLPRTCGWRSWGGWCVLLAALLAMATYILFEELDVLGSKLPSRLAGEAVAALEYTVLDAERLSHLHLSVERSSNAAPSFVIPISTVNIFHNSESFAAGISRTTLRTLRARAHVRPQTLPSSTSPADPF